MLFIFSFISCDDEYELSEIAPKNDARVIKANIAVHYVDWKYQRTYYDHENKVITIKMLEDSFQDGKEASAMIVFITPTLWATMTPYGGEEEDWSSGSRQYDIISGDETVTNTYTIKIEEVASF